MYSRMVLGGVKLDYLLSFKSTVFEIFATKVFGAIYDSNL